MMKTTHSPAIHADGTVRKLRHRHPANPQNRPALVIAPAGAPLPEPPPSASLRDRCPPVMDQDPLGSCTAHAFTSALRFLHLRDGVDEPLSRLFCYWATRVLVEGKPPAEDSGCIIANVVTTLESYGVCVESLWPYDVGRLADKPPQEAFDDALNRKVVVATPVTTLRALKQSIADGFPVPIAFTVAKSVEDGEDGRGSHTWETGSFPLPADDDPANYPQSAGVLTPSVPLPEAPDHGVGIHTVLAIGYDDATAKVKIQNSWGTRFGDGGFGDLDYAFFGPTQDADLNSHTAPCMAYDAWTVRLQTDQLHTTGPMAMIETAPGDLSVPLPESAGSGLAWTVTRLAAGLAMLGSDFTPPAGGGAGHAVGGSGVRRFHFHVADVGTYVLAFQLSHPWMKDETPVDVRTFQIVVK